jgi:hypothetical protein
MYPITHKSKDIELQTIRTILNNNHYNQEIIHTNLKHNHNTKETQKQKWATFTYFGTDTRTITKLLKNANIKISFKTTNTIKNHLRPKQQIADPYNNSGVYQLKCNESPLKYIGQTGRTFKTRYKKHIQGIKTNEQN